MIGLGSGLSVAIVFFVVGLIVQGFSVGVVLAGFGGVAGVVATYIIMQILKSKEFRTALEKADSPTPDNELAIEIRKKIEKALELELGKMKEKISVMFQKYQDFKDKFDKLKKEIEMQTNKVNIVVTASEELSASAAEVASRIVSVAQKIEETAKTAQGGLLKMDEIVKIMNTIVSAMESIRDMARGLESETKEISEIISIIEDITDQTNLLALNAAIEAARAGEQGKGFAVVASEVRKLAERTYGAAREISEKINAMVQRVSQTYSSIEDGFQIIKKGTEIVQEGKSSFEQVSKRTSEINTETAAISSTTEEQSKVTDEISRNLLSLLDSAKKVEAIQSEASATYEEISQDMAKFIGTDYKKK